MHKVPRASCVAMDTICGGKKASSAPTDATVRMPRTSYGSRCFRPPRTAKPSARAIQSPSPMPTPTTTKERNDLAQSAGTLFGRPYNPGGQTFCRAHGAGSSVQRARTTAASDTCDWRWAARGAQRLA